MPVLAQNDKPRFVGDGELNVRGLMGIEKSEKLEPTPPSVTRRGASEVLHFFRGGRGICCFCYPERVLLLRRLASCVVACMLHLVVFSAAGTGCFLFSECTTR